MDTFPTEKERMFSPPNNSYPQSLPNYWKNPETKEVLDLTQLSDDELNSIGWNGPIEMPPLEGTSKYTHDYEWNKENHCFDAIEVNQYEKEKRVDYGLFWTLLLRGIGEESTSGIAYQKIKNTSKQSLEVNTIVTEFIALLNDAKYGNAKINKIQETLVDIMQNISFTQEEYQEIQEIFVKSGMFSIYILQ
jgi:hypothetical protein